MGKGQATKAGNIRSIGASTLADMKSWVRLVVGVSITTLVAVAFAALLVEPPAPAAVVSAPGSHGAPLPNRTV